MNIIGSKVSFENLKFPFCKNSEIQEIGSYNPKACEVQPYRKESLDGYAYVQHCQSLNNTRLTSWEQLYFDPKVLVLNF